MASLLFLQAYTNVTHTTKTMKMNIFHNNISKITVFRYPVDTRRRFNVYKTSCVYRVKFPQIIEKNVISGYGCQPFKRQIKKMSKHTQTIRRVTLKQLIT